MSRQLLLILPAWLVISTAYAQEKCTPECICDKKSISNLPIPAPRGFTLTTACELYDTNFKPIDRNSLRTMRAEHFDYGIYFYRGTTTMSGHITKVDDGPNGTMVYFYPRIDHPSNTNDLSRLQQFVLLDQIILQDSERIGTASLIETETVSWCADATLTFRALSVRIADTSGIGVEAMKYDVVRVGKYRKC